MQPHFEQRQIKNIYDFEQETERIINGRHPNIQIVQLSNATKLKALFDGIYPEPDVQDTFGTYYGQYFRGFFKTPFTGNYTIYVASDDQAEFFIQTTNFSTTRPTKALV